jgi:hypothetical protein
MVRQLTRGETPSEHDIYSALLLGRSDNSDVLNALAWYALVLMATDICADARNVTAWLSWMAERSGDPPPAPCISDKTLWSQLRGLAYFPGISIDVPVRYRTFRNGVFRATRFNRRVTDCTFINCDMTGAVFTSSTQRTTFEKCN